MAIRCSTCNKNLLSEDNFVEFVCPKCTNSKIVRCQHCRLSSNSYRCRCGYEGP